MKNLQSNCFVFGTCSDKSQKMGYRKSALFAVRAWTTNYKNHCEIKVLCLSFATP